MAFKAVLLDLDDTLVDFLKMSEEEAFEKIFAIYEKHGWEEEKALQRLLHKKSGRVDYKILAHGIIAYRKEKAARLALHEGVRETLNPLKEKRLKLGIVTDAPQWQAYTGLVGLGIEDYFDVVVCFEATNVHKPDALPFNKALSLLGAKADEVLFVGDWLVPGIIGGAQEGEHPALAQ